MEQHVQEDSLRGLRCDCGIGRLGETLERVRVHVRGRPVVPVAHAGVLGGRRAVCDRAATARAEGDRKSRTQSRIDLGSSIQPGGVMRYWSRGVAALAGAACTESTPGTQPITEET